MKKIYKIALCMLCAQASSALAVRDETSITLGAKKGDQIETTDNSDNGKRSSLQAMKDRRMRANKWDEAQEERKKKNKAMIMKMGNNEGEINKNETTGVQIQNEGEVNTSGQSLYQRDQELTNYMVKREGNGEQEEGMGEGTEGEGEET